MTGVEGVAAAWRLDIVIIAILLSACSGRTVNRPEAPVPPLLGVPTYDEFVSDCPGSSYRAAKVRAEAVETGSLQVATGMTMQEVRKVMGMPDYAVLLGAKGPNAANSGWSWMYYVVKPQIGIVNLQTDKYLEVGFDLEGRVVWLSNHL